jgi:hypothetical protein
MEDNDTIHDEAIRICSEYKINVKSNGYLLGSSWMVSCDEIQLMPKNLQMYSVTYKDIRAVYLLEKKGVLSIGRLPKEGTFPVEIDNEKFPTRRDGYRSHLFEKPSVVQTGAPFPSSLLLVYFNENLLNKFVEEDDASLKRGTWVDKIKGEYQFPNKRVHREQAAIKKKVFREMMDLYYETGIVNTSDLAKRVSLLPGRTRTEINHISNKMKISVGYEFHSEGKGYYKLRKTRVN